MDFSAFLWQGALVGAIYIGVRQLLQGKSPVARYRLAMCALLVIAVLPIITFMILAKTMPSISAYQIPHNFATLYLNGDNPNAAVPSSIVYGLQVRLQPFIPWSALLWILGVSIATFRVFRSWQYADQLKETATSISLEKWHSVIEKLRSFYGIRRVIRVAVSIRVAVPCVIGWLKPVILIPPSAMTGLTPEQMELILAHEMAHIYRMDYLWNLLQVVVETMLFYHPVVHWVSFQARLERELCCDDIVVGLHGNPVAYARTLTELESLRRPSRALALGATGGQVFNRIHRLFGLQSQDAPVFWVPLLAITGLLLSLSIMQLIHHQLQLESIVATKYDFMGVPGRQNLAPSFKAGSLTVLPTRIKATMLTMPDFPKPIGVNTTPPAVTPGPVPLSAASLVPSSELVAKKTPITPGNTDRHLVAANFIEVHEPVYPPFALERGVEGSVTLEFTVTPGGSVKNLHVTKVIGSRLFGQAAMDALRQWKFNPETLNGRPVAQQLVEEFVFQLKPPAKRSGPCKIPTGYHLCLSRQLLD